jgi:threonyl-tRNA synthetase
VRNEKINYKVREHSLAKVPALLVVGRKEAAERTVSVRRLGSQDQRTMPLEAALQALLEEAAPPDLRRTSGLSTEGKPESHLTLDSHHEVSRVL